MRRHLKEEFVKGGFLFELERRDINKAIYKVKDLDSRVIHYEVINIIIRMIDPKSFIHQKYRDMGYSSIEVYPPDNLWGEKGWTYTELWRAVNKYNSIKRRVRKNTPGVDLEKLLNSLNS